MNAKLMAYTFRLTLLSYVLLVVQLAVPALLSFLAWGPLGLIFWSVLLIGFITFSRSSPTKLLASLRELSPYQAPQLFVMVNTLAQRAGLQSMPRIFLSEAPQINAAAFRLSSEPTSNGLLVTRGLLESLSAPELRGVLAHEISHIRSGDVERFRLLLVVQTIQVSLALSFVLFFPFDPALSLLALAFLPLGRLINAWYSRTREFAADLGAALISNDALSLAKALYRIEYRPRTWLEALMGYRFPTSANADPVQRMYRSHPSSEERIRRLQEVAAAMEATQPSYLERIGYPRSFRLFF